MLPLRFSARTVDLLDPSERAIDPDLIKKALVIIAPNEKDESSCHSAVVDSIWHGRSFNRGSTDAAKGAKSILVRLNGALHKVKKSVAELPPSLRDELFTFELRPRDGKFYFGNDTFSEFCIELDTLAQMVDANIGSSRRKVNYKKRNAAFIARYLMMEFGRRPTTTVEGPFFRLASIFYEAITGVSEANLDRQCRTVLKIK